MTQKNYGSDRRTNPMYPVVVARQTHQWECQDYAAQSTLGLPMDHAIRVVGSGSGGPTTPSCPAGRRGCRADGGSNPSPAQKHEQSLGLLGGRGDPRRFARSGSPFLAVESDDPSDFGPSPRGDSQATGSESTGTGAARPDCPPPERCATDRLYRRALSGVSVSPRGREPQGRRERAGQWDRPKFLQMDNDMSLSGWRSQGFQEIYNPFLKKRLIRQAQCGCFQITPPRLPRRIRVPHTLPLYRSQIWFIRRIDKEDHIQILNETIRLSERYAQEFVRVVLRTGHQTLSILLESFRPATNAAHWSSIL